MKPEIEELNEIDFVFSTVRVSEQQHLAPSAFLQKPQSPTRQTLYGGVNEKKLHCNQKA